MRKVRALPLWVRLVCFFITAGLMSFTRLAPRAGAQTGSDNPRELQRTFQIVWETIHQKYFDPSLGGCDWNEVRRRYETQIASINTKPDAARISQLIQYEHLFVISLCIIPFLGATLWWLLSRTPRKQQWGDTKVAVTLT
jgi:hypothetical protein